MTSTPLTPVPPVPPVTTSDRWKIELKVIASTAAVFGVSVVLAVLNAVQDHHELLGSTPSALQTILLVIVPSLITFTSGYLARHTPRGPGAS